MAYAEFPLPSYPPAQDPADRFKSVLYEFSITEPSMLEMMTLPTFTIKKLKFVIKSTRSFVHATMNIDGTTMKFSVGKICNIDEKYDEDLPVLDLGGKSLNTFLENKVTNRFIMFGKLVTNNIPLPAVPVVTKKGWVVPPNFSSPFRPRRKESQKSGKKVDKKSDKKSGKVRKNKRSKKLRV
jgi:hypothetical protein